MCVCRLGMEADVRPLHAWHAEQVQHALHLARAAVLDQVGCLELWSGSSYLRHRMHTHG